MSKKIDCKKVFGTACNFEVKGFAEKSEFVPTLDENYLFDPKTTLAILAGFAFNRRVLIQGMHGTGKSTHIEQVAARLNWPCLRINFDSQITRLDLVGKDVIKLKDGKQITEFKEGIIPFALRLGIALVLDEYDAIKTDVSFVIQRLLEEEGKFAMLEENEIITPNQHFRLFATSNTLGAGDDLGIYHGTNLINQAQMDRWNIVASLNYLDEKHELEILLKKMPFLNSKPHQHDSRKTQFFEEFSGRENFCDGTYKDIRNRSKNFSDAKITKKAESCVSHDHDTAKMMVRLANLTREAFKNGDISNLISLRTLISWGKNIEIFGSVKTAFNLSFGNKVIDDEKVVIREFYQRVFGEEITNDVSTDDV